MEKALADYDRDYKIQYEKFTKHREEQERPITNREVVLMKRLNERYEQQKFRFEDDILQKLKGQPSLSDENTGKQFKNDKV